MKKILIVDDHPVYLQGLAMLMRESSLDVRVNMVADFTHAKQKIKQQQPDLLLLDLMLPDTKDFNGLQELIADYPSLTIAILSASEDKAHIRTAIKHGAKGYIFKTLSLDELLIAIEIMLSGECYLPECQVLDIQESQLTKRQIEIICLVSQGLSNKEIAKKLHISESTVKKHLYSIFKKLKVKNRIQAIQWIKTKKNLE